MTERLHVHKRTDGRAHSQYRGRMKVNSENVYLETLIAHRMPQGIGIVSLSQLALVFSKMAKELRGQEAPAQQQEAFQSAIADAAASARHLTAVERTAVQSTLFTAFDGLPRKHASMAVRADFLRQVRFPPGTGSVAPLYASAAMSAQLHRQRVTTRATV